jgi:hypothetical protein
VSFRHADIDTIARSLDFNERNQLAQSEDETVKIGYLFSDSFNPRKARAVFERVYRINAYLHKDASGIA